MAPYVDALLANLTPVERVEHWLDIATAVGTVLVIAGSVNANGVSTEVLGELLLYLVVLLRIYRWST